MRAALISLWDKGGMLHYAVQLANSLCTAAEIILVLPESTPAESLAVLRLDPGVRVVRVRALTQSTGNPKVIVAQFLEIWRLVRKIRRDRPDVLHVTAAHFWLIFLLPLLRLVVPIASTVHDAAPHPGLDNTLRKRLEIRAQVRHSLHLFVHAESIERQLRERFAGGERLQITVIPHGDYGFFRGLNPGSVAEEPDTILFFGRIRAYKGLDVMLDAYERLRPGMPAARLIVAGEGPIPPGLLERIHRGGVELHNRFIPEPEVGILFQRSSIVVCPYLEASQSGIVPIAYAFRKPVVATRVGGLPEAVEDGRTGLLVPPGDPAALAAAVLALMKDPKSRAEFGENGFRKMEQELGWAGIAGRTIEVYERLAGAGSSWLRESPIT